MASKENAVINSFRLAASKLGARLFRNNVGMAETKDGRRIKYGVCNPGGSDLIGWTPVVVTEGMVGAKVAIFTAIEVKAGSQNPTPAQKQFIRVIEEAGGFAHVARVGDDLKKILSR